MWRILNLKLSFILVLSVALPTSLQAQRCGKERWAVKTGIDSGAGSVGLSSPQPAKIADLITIAPPSPLPTDSRFTPTENTVFVVDATLTDFKFESGSTGDSDYHLVLQDDLGNTMVAEIPSPNCVGADSPFAAQITSARSKFDSQFQARSSFQTANVAVRVTGVGFFDFFHNQHGAAPNVIELHPVLDIVFDPGPPEGDFNVAVSAPSMHLHSGSASSVKIAATPVGNGKLPNVGFAVAGVPAGVTSRVTPGPNGQANLALSAAPGASGGTFPVTVTGSANGRSHSQTFALNVSSPPAEAEEQQWEYKLISASTEKEVMEQADKLGSAGWELVSVVRSSGNPAWKAFFKRPTRD